MLSFKQMCTLNALYSEFVLFISFEGECSFSLCVFFFVYFSWYHCCALRYIDQNAWDEIDCETLGHWQSVTLERVLCCGHSAVWENNECVFVSLRSLYNIQSIIVVQNSVSSFTSTIYVYMLPYYGVIDLNVTVKGP